MAVTATGAIGLAMTKLATHISSSATFQAACEVATAGAALEFIHYPWAEFNLIRRPFAIISQGEEYTDFRAAGGASTLLLPTGSLKLMLAINHDSNYSEADNFLLADNFFSGVLQDLKQLSGISDNLNITEIALAQPPAISDPTTTIDQSQDKEANPMFWLVGYSVKWGAV